jgi:hypothetical protein
MRNILAGVLLLLFFMPGLAAAATINAASCSYADVLTAVNAAQSGDTVLVPAGSCTWNNYITISKTLTIKGAGIGNTILTENNTQHGARIFYCDIPDNDRVTISDIEIRTVASESQSWANDGIIVLTGTAQNYMKFRIHHVKFTGMKVFAIRILNVYGLIDHNQFINQQSGATSVFISGDNDAAFLRSVELGGANAIFVEDNIFNSSAAYSAWLEQWYGNRIVIRHNIFRNVWISSHGYGDVGEGARGPVLIEYYNNVADCDDNTGPNYCFGAMGIRGGTGAIYNNTWTETGGATWSNAPIGMIYYGLFYTTDDVCGVGTHTTPRCLLYPCMDQPGRVGTTQMPIHIWNNTYMGVGNPFLVIDPISPQDGYDCNTTPKIYNTLGMCSAGSPAGPCFVRENRDYYLRPPQPGDAIYPYTPYTYPHPLAVESSTINAASCSYEDVLSAITAAQSGDTVLVSAGSCAWNSTLIITKGITLQGAGIDQTILKGQVVLLTFSPDSVAVSNHDTLKIEGFTFDGDDSTSEQLHWSGLVIAGVGYGIADHVNLIILRNKFKRTTATGIYLRQPIYGVAAYNQFDSIAMPIRIMGSEYYSWSSQTQEYGTANNFYFENNNMFFSPNLPSSYSGWPGWIETGQGGRIVVRYNTWDETNVQPTEYWDVHGLQNLNAQGKCEGYSTMVAEYYGNKIIHASTGYRWMYDRGGWLMMFINSIDSTSSGAGNTGVTQYYCDTCQWNGSYVQKVHNTYFWNNMHNGENEIAYVSDPGSGFGCPSDPIVENIDFFNYNPSCIKDSCLAGVGCGSDTPTGTCTPGVGYWKTSQSCSDISSMVGANPATPISGTFYKCTAPNTWTAYYTPYAYPHPLASSSSPPQPVPGDLNGDRLVDINDLALMALHFGQTNTHPLWNATADVVADNEIDIYDIVFVSTRFT